MGDPAPVASAGPVRSISTASDCRSGRKRRCAAPDLVEPGLDPSMESVVAPIAGHLRDSNRQGPIVTGGWSENVNHIWPHCAALFWPHLWAWEDVGRAALVTLCD